MRKNNIVTARSSNFALAYFRPINRKRSQRWLSDETRLFNKYGLGGCRYRDLYVL
jgi:hypothetical protein